MCVQAMTPMMRNACVCAGYDSYDENGLCVCAGMTPMMRNACVCAGHDSYDEKCLCVCRP